MSTPVEIYTGRVIKDLGLKPYILSWNTGDGSLITNAANSHAAVAFDKELQAKLEAELDFAHGRGLTDSEDVWAVCWLQ